MAKCPECNGVGFSIRIYDGIRNGERRGWIQRKDCTLCGGTGLVQDEHAHRWIEERRSGRALRDARVAVGLSQKDAVEVLKARGFDLDAVRLSQIEAGRAPIPPGFGPEVYDGMEDG